VLKSILVVEEHDEMRAALRDWLLVSLPPSNLREARNLEEALVLAGRSVPDLVLMNLELPGPNGIEATRELRRLCPSCPVVIMSVNDSEALRSAALGAGAAAFVSKRELPHGLLPILGRYTTI
jgi:DNA-binding NarL/FixJ family response regulator